MSSKSVSARIILVSIAIAAVLFSWCAVRWQLGFMLANLTSPNESNAKNTAEFALALSPKDPLVNWLSASVNKNDFTNESTAEPIGDFENVVRLSPNNYVWWIELGRAYEQSNQPEKAEKVFLRAVELAPHYTFPRWQLGNFYLRRGDEAKAFVQLQKTAENNPAYREQVFSIAWEFYEQNTAKLEELAGNSPSVRAFLAKFYALKERAADSLRMWNTLTPEEKKENADVAKVVAQGLYEKGFYREAIDFVRDLNIEPNAKTETVQNGGFEDSIGEADYTYFNWSVAKITKIDVKLDPTQKHEGNRSLRVAFNNFSGGIFYNIYQIVAVEPSAKYILSFWVKTEELKSGGMPTLEIANSTTNKIIATSESFPTGTNNWKQIQIAFTAPDDAEAITIRTSRAYCGEACLIIGAFWYDDFHLEKLNKNTNIK